MKKILYFLPLIILVVYIILFFPLRNHFVVLETQTGESFQEVLDRAYGHGEYGRPGTSYDPIHSIEMVAKHYVFQGITIVVILISTILKKICNAEKMEINKNLKKINIMVYTILIVVLIILTIYTTVINTTFLL